MSMSASVAKSTRHVEVTSGDRAVRLPLIGAARSHPTVTSGSESVAGDWILPLIRRAQERVMSQKEALYVIGIDKAQYIRNLNGEGHLSVRRLGLLPEDFWRALIDELRAHFKMDDDSERLARALDGLQSSVTVIADIARKALR